jgi:hypothetical protein
MDKPKTQYPARKTERLNTTSKAKSRKDPKSVSRKDKYKAARKAKRSKENQFMTDSFIDKPVEKPAEGFKIRRFLKSDLIKDISKDKKTVEKKGAFKAQKAIDYMTKD